MNSASDRLIRVLATSLLHHGADNEGAFFGWMEAILAHQVHVRLRSRLLVVRVGDEFDLGGSHGGRFAT
jgi:hypothetical protein